MHDCLYQVRYYFLVLLLLFSACSFFFKQTIAGLRLLIYSDTLFVGELKLYKVSAEKCLLILLTLVHSCWFSYCFFFTFSSSSARIVSVCCIGYNEFFPGSSSQELYFFSVVPCLKHFLLPLWKVARCLLCGG